MEDASPISPLIAAKGETMVPLWEAETQLKMELGIV
jgi:hypothetical protein